jgi:hypothetical protein
MAIRGMVSPDVVFVFAPRDFDELAATKLLLQASHAYAIASAPLVSQQPSF